MVKLNRCNEMMEGELKGGNKYDWKEYDYGSRKENFMNQFHGKSPAEEEEEARQRDAEYAAYLEKERQEGGLCTIC